MEKFKLAKVTWVDAFSMVEWQSLEEVLENAKSDDWEVTEVGWILEDNEAYIVLASQFNKAGNWGNITKIPKSWLITVQFLKGGGPCKR